MLKCPITVHELFVLQNRTLTAYDLLLTLSCKKTYSNRADLTAHRYNWKILS